MTLAATSQKMALVFIEQAKGWLASRDDISPKQAIDRMRQEARATRRSVADLAEEVLVGGLAPRPVWPATQR